MRDDLADSPLTKRARIVATRTLLEACRSQLGGTNTALVYAYAEHAHRLQEQLNALEEALLSSNDAAMSAHAGGKN